MSGEAVGWAYRHSPATGSTMAIHIAIADSVNDQHDWLFWLNLDKLAKKARIDVHTAGRAVRKLVELGCLDEIEPPNGRAGVYRFCFREDAAVVYETRRSTRKSATPSTRKSAGSTRKSATPRLVIDLTQVTEPSGGDAETSPAERPLAQELVTLYVDNSREYGHDPSREEVGMWARAIKAQIDVGKSRRVLRRAVGRASEEGKHPKLLTWLIGEVERELATKEGRRA